MFRIRKKKTNKPGEKLGCRVRLYERDSRIYQFYQNNILINTVSVLHMCIITKNDEFHL